MIRTTLFEDAKRQNKIEDIAGKLTTLKNAGAERRGQCPLCKAGKNKGVGAPFAVRLKRGDFVCYVCGKHGDVVDLVAEHDGLTTAEAARKLLGAGYEPTRLDGAPAPRAQAKTPDESQLRKIERAASLWAASRPIEGTIAWAYLRARGISDSVIARAAPRIRFHPLTHHAWDEGARAWSRFPAMLLRRETELGGPVAGIHATFLLKDGSGRDKALGKLMLGPQKDADGLPGGAWLIGPAGDGDLCVAEGCETTLAMATLAERRGERVRAVAALSLNDLQGGALYDDGCLDVNNVQADPERAPFLWSPPADAPWKRVVVGCDHDMSPINVMGRTVRGKPCRMELDRAARAKLCGRLATQAWRRTGIDAIAIAPPPGFDFCDELMRARVAA